MGTLNIIRNKLVARIFAAVNREVLYVRCVEICFLSLLIRSAQLACFDHRMSKHRSTQGRQGRRRCPELVGRGNLLDWNNASLLK